MWNRSSAWSPSSLLISKGSVEFICKDLFKAFREFRVRINAIAPGNILFEDSVWDKKLKNDKESVNRLLNEEVPLKDFGSPQDVANLATFLSSPLASNITGEVMITDGGQTRS